MFRVQTSKEIVSLSKEQLLQTLIQKVAEVRKSDHEILAKTIADYLEVNGALKSTTVLQLLTLAFSAGYFYRVFLDKNNVTVEIPNASTSSSEGSDESSRS
jgi:3'-phosphoadenosine 5'-phosphosulfate sulfotransferase (PAPS reductase)/FAD synthetase